MRFGLAFLLAAHGVAHLVGFVSSWKLATLAELPYKTTVFSVRVDVGEAGARVMGVLWLLAALAFLVAAIPSSVVKRVPAVRSEEILVPKHRWRGSHPPGSAWLSTCFGSA